MSVFRFQLTFPQDSLLPADYITNTFHFENPAAPIITDYDNVRDILADFFTVAPTAGGSSLQTYLSSTMGSPVAVKAYDLSDPLPRAPVYTSSFTLTAAGSGLLPAENAVVLSFQARTESGVDQRRRRNRVYLGTWGSNANTTLGQVASTQTLQIQRAAQDMFDAAQASSQWQWVIWSPTDQVAKDVDNGWVDNAWDHQRRRGTKASTRQTFS